MTGGDGREGVRGGDWVRSKWVKGNDGVRKVKGEGL